MLLVEWRGTGELGRPPIVLICTIALLSLVIAVMSVRAVKRRRAQELMPRPRPVRA